jgi:hypothetical protein
MSSMSQAEEAELCRETECLEQFEALLLRWSIEFSTSERGEFLDFYNQMKHFFNASST